MIHNAPANSLQADPLRVFCFALDAAVDAGLRPPLYGIPADCLQEAIEWPVNHITRVPGSPAGLIGIISHRGHLLAVADLLHIFGQGAFDTSKPFKLLIVELAGHRFAVAARDIGRILTFASDTQQPKPMGIKQASGLVTGLLDSEAGIISMLSLKNLLVWYGLLPESEREDPIPTTAQREYISIFRA